MDTDSSDRSWHLEIQPVLDPFTLQGRFVLKGAGDLDLAVGPVDTCVGFKASLRLSGSSVYLLDVSMHKGRSDISSFSRLAVHLEQEFLKLTTKRE